LETIAAYLDGQVAEGTRARIARHLAGCETCYFVFTEAAQVRKVEVEAAVDEPVPVPADDHWLKRWRVVRSSVAAAVAMAACALLSVEIGLVPWSMSGSTELRALVAAVGTERPVEARLSGGFEYGPLRATRGRANSLRPVSPDVRIAVALSEKRALAQQTPRTLQALGIGYLVMGEVGRAVPLLEQAVDGPAPPAGMLSDLSAAYLVRAARDHDPQDLAKALAVADRAVHADATLPEALFNRALALERLSLTNEAFRAWQDFVALDGASAWAAEARVHLDALKP
jgi:predicted anti-sigma-YlaC factor YlaD